MMNVAVIETVVNGADVVAVAAAVAAAGVVGTVVVVAAGVGFVDVEHVVVAVVVVV